MSRKLLLWLIFTLLSVRVLSCSWKCCKKNNDPIVLKNQIINDSDKLSNHRNFNSKILSESVSTDKIVGIHYNKYSNEANNKVVGSIKDNRDTEKKASQNINEENVVSPLRENRWFQCWVLKAIFINKRNFPVVIMKLILSYLTFPITASLCHHEGGLSEAIFSRNGRWLLSADVGHPALHYHLSNITTGKEVHTVKSPNLKRHIYLLAIADSHLFVVSGDFKSNNYNMYLWNTYSGEFETTLIGHTGYVTCCSIFLNDTRMASASMDKTVRVWKVGKTQGSCLYVLRGHTGYIRTCVVSADNQWIFSLSDDKTIRVWITNTGECHLVLVGHTQILYSNSCVISVDNRHIGSIGMHGETKLWDIITGECTKTIKCINVESINVGHTRHICYLSSKRLVWWQRYQVGVWDLRANKNIYTLSFEIPVRNVFTDGEYLIVLLHDGMIYLDRKNLQIPLIQVYIFESGIFIE